MQNWKLKIENLEVRNTAWYREKTPEMGSFFYELD